MMDTNKMREEFEAAFSKKTAGMPLPAGTDEEFEEAGGFERALLESMVDDRIGDTYGENVFASAWWAWQTSRASLVIELPNPAETLAGPTLYAQFKESVEASGAKVKVKS